MRKYAIILAVCLLFGGIDRAAADTAYAISWSISGEVFTEYLAEGAPVVAPASVPVCNGKTFVGWTERAVVEEDGSDFTAISDFGLAVSDTTFYAVFARQVEIEASAYKATRITDESDLEPNALYIIENDGFVAVNGTLDNGLLALPAYETVGLEGNERYVWQLVPSTAEGSFYIQSANDTRQVYNTTTSNVSLRAQGTGAVYTFSCDGTIWDIQGPDSRYLCYSDASQSAYRVYKAYKTKTDLTPHDIHLYKLSPEEPEIVYQNYSTMCVQTVETPVASLPGGKYTGEQVIRLTCATVGATIRYTIDGSEPTETSVAYEEENPIRKEDSFVLKACAFAEGMEPSAVLTVTYDIDKGYATSIAEFIAVASSDTYELRFTASQEAVITGLDPQLGCVYVQDNSGKGLMIYCGSGTASVYPQGAEVGQKIIGALRGVYMPDYHGVPRMYDVAWSEDIRFVDAVRPEPLLVTAIDVAQFEAHPLVLIKIENVTFQSAVMIQSENGTAYKFDGTSLGVTTNRLVPESTVLCDVVGILTRNVNGAVIMPALLTDIDTKGAVAELPAFEPEGGNAREEATETLLVVVTPAAGTSMTISETAYTNQQTIVLTEEYLEIQVVARRDFYADNAVTQWYKAAEVIHIQWSVNGVIDETLARTIVAGQPIAVLPEEPVACSGKVFIGWTDIETIPQGEPDFTLISKETVPSEDAVYYAVFATKEEKGGYTNYSDFSTTCVDTPSETDLTSGIEMPLQPVKLIGNGQLFLILGEKKYNAQGMLVEN